MSDPYFMMALEFWKPVPGIHGGVNRRTQRPRRYDAKEQKREATYPIPKFDIEMQEFCPVRVSAGLPLVVASGSTISRLSQ